MVERRELNLDDYLSMLRRQWWILVVSTVLGVSIGFGLTEVLPKRYTSQTLVLVEPPIVPHSYVQPVVTENLNARLASMQEQIFSRTRLQAIVEQFGLYKEDRNRVALEELVDRLRKSVTVEPVKPMAETQSTALPGFYVSVTLNNPQLAQQVCAQITSMFMEQNLRLRQQQAEDTTNFLAKQLKDAKDKLDEHDARLADFERRYMGELPGDEKTSLNLLMSLTPQLEAVTQALSRAQQDKAFAETMLTQQMEAWKASQAGSDAQTLGQQLNLLQNELVTLRARYTDDHPDVIKLKNDIAQLRSKIKEADSGQQNSSGGSKELGAIAEPAQIQQLRAQIHQYELTIRENTNTQEQLQQQIKTLQARIRLRPQVEQEFKQLTRDHETALGFYNDLLRKRNESEMATDLERRQEGEQFRVLDPANLPEKPSFPDPLRFTTGGLGGGLALGLGLIAFLESRDKRIRTERDVQCFLELPTLALIPWIKPQKTDANGNGKGLVVPAKRGHRRLDART